LPLNNLNIKRELLFEQYRKSKNIKYLSQKDLSSRISIRKFKLGDCPYIKVYIDVINN